MPGEVLARILAVPAGYLSHFADLTSAVLNVTLPEAERSAADEMPLQFVSELLEHRAAHPGDDLLSRLLAQVRAGRAARIVEELLRLWSIVQAGPRRATRGEIVLAGRRVPAGIGLIGSLPAANRDPLAFRNRTAGLDELDVEADSRGHVAFGAGVHQCLGQRPARAELRAALPAVLAGLPGLRLAVAPEQLRYMTGHAILGLHELPVRWSASVR